MSGAETIFYLNTRLKVFKRFLGGQRFQQEYFENYREIVLTPVVAGGG